MVFLFILAFLLLIIIILVTSSAQIEIANLSFSSQRERHLNKDYKIIFKLYILKKIPIVKMEITKTKMEKFEIKEKVKELDKKLIKNTKNFDKKILKAIKEIQIEIAKLELKIKIGTENASVTAIIVPIISTVISIFLRNKITNTKEQKYEIEPIYQNQNFLKIQFSGIFRIKISHIISMIYMLSKKEGVRKNERTSNRRSYDYSYE